MGRQQVVAERLDARRVAQVEAVDLEPVAPVVEVRLLRVAGGRVAREARRHDQVRAGAQQLDPGLVADLHAAAREQRDAALEVGGLGALREVELGARRAELVVEVVQLAVGLLADVAVLLLDRLARRRCSRSVRLEALRRVDVRRREHRPLAQHADAGVGEHRLVGADARVALLLALRLREAAALDDVGVEDVGRGREQARALLDRQRAEQAAVARDRLEQLGRRAQPRPSTSSFAAVRRCSRPSTSPGRVSGGGWPAEASTRAARLRAMAADLPDSDPVETQEWLDSVDAVVESDGRERMGFLLDQAIDHAQDYGVKVSAGLSTPVREHDPGRRGAASSRATRSSSGSRRRSCAGTRSRSSCRRTPSRPSSAATSRATSRPRRSTRSASTTSGARAPRSTAATSSTCRATRRPGIYARAFLEGRLSEEQLRRFRQEVDGGGLSSYPHPWLMPDFWQFPTVSMGLGPLMAIYQARFMKYLAARGVRRPGRPQGLGVHGRRRDGRAGVDGRDLARRPREARQPRLRRSTATCSASTARCAATARSSRSSRRTSAAPAGT